jgi:hypothetical protein
MNRLRRNRNSNHSNNNHNHNYEYVINDDERYAINYYTSILNRQLQDIDLLYNEVTHTRNILNYLMHVGDYPSYTRERELPQNQTRTPQNQTRTAQNQTRTPQNNSLADYSIYFIPFGQISSTTENRTTRLQPSDFERNITQRIFSEIENPINTTCPIELYRFEPSSLVSQINHCGHIFDRVGINQWFNRSTRCPICRYDLINPISNTETSSTAQRSTDFSLRQLFTDSSLNTLTEGLFNSIFTDSSLNTLTEDILNSINDYRESNVISRRRRNNDSNGLEHTDISNNLGH